MSDPLSRFRPLMLIAVVFTLAASSARAQAEIEKTFAVDKEAEVLLDLTAAAPGTSWAESGREAAAAVVFVDGRYQQDVILFGGARRLTYRLMLGRLAPGSHRVRVAYNPKQSAAGAPTLEISDVGITMVGRSDPEFQALSLAPILYARPDTIGRFSDVPLLAWYETEQGSSGTTIRYSVIFTNEDGGTQTNALMARWGRTTDIELVYEARIDPQGRLTASIFQGKDHKYLPFRGRREAEHPLFIVATRNNMFGDKGQSAMRFAVRPIAFDLSRASREELMFQHPWTYELMVAELVRENKLNESSRVGQQIADPRRYLYLQASAEQQNTAISFAVRLRGDPRWYTSDAGIQYYKIDRGGHFQTTVRLPPGTTLDRIERLAVRCDVAGDPRSLPATGEAAKVECELKAIRRVFMLDENYRPGPSLPLGIRPLKLQYGDMVEIYESGKPAGETR